MDSRHRICERQECGEPFVRPRSFSSQLYCSPRCSKIAGDERKLILESERPKVKRKRHRRERPQAPAKPDARPCRECQKPFEPLRASQLHCGVCRPIVEEIRRCEECQKPFRATSKAAKFCCEDCRAIWYDRNYRLKQSCPPAVVADDDDPEDAVVLEIEDAPRRKRLLELMVKWGHPIWTAAEEPPPEPVKRHRPTIQEECRVIVYGGGERPTRTPWRYGR